MTQQSIPTGKQLQRKNTQGFSPSDFSPTGSTPIPHTSHYISETQLRNRSGVGGSTTMTEQTPPLTGQRGSDNHRAKEKPHSIFSVGSGHHKISHTSYQRDNGQQTLREEAADIHSKNSPCTKRYYTHIGYTGLFLHKNSPPRQSEGLVL